MHQKRSTGPCLQCGTLFARRTRAGKPKQFCTWDCLQASRTPESRFWAKVNKDGPVPDACPEMGACWVWTGALFTDNGYGQFWLNDTNCRAHIVSYEWANGPVDGQQVQHLCNVRVCVRPTHLTLGTPAQNMAYASQTGRMTRGERHHRSVVTAVDVRLIRKLAAEGVRQIDLVDRFGISKSTMHAIVHRLTWKHVV
jgi:hypothetical protein